MYLHANNPEINAAKKAIISPYISLDFKLIEDESKIINSITVIPIMGNKTIKKEISASSLVPNMSGCKWPIGHPGDDDFYFCGKPTIPGKPYCGEHCLIAYRRKDSHQKVKKFFKLNSEV